MTIINSISNFGTNNNVNNEKNIIKRPQQIKFENENSSISSSFKNDNILSAHVTGEGVSDCKLL
ncbi:hypothetical protein RB653_006452 [Dictyostelium firmibasis]|uniref:Uncharacterized protein n=1 Tax=Dictyostelium firmibasis TaxID=79012 RepID=A0AAN7UEI9_9MYCE